MSRRALVFLACQKGSSLPDLLTDLPDDPSWEVAHAVSCHNGDSSVASDFMLAVDQYRPSRVVLLLSSLCSVADYVIVPTTTVERVDGATRWPCGGHLIRGDVYHHVDCILARTEKVLPHTVDRCGLDLPRTSREIPMYNGLLGPIVEVCTVPLFPVVVPEAVGEDPEHPLRGMTLRIISSAVANMGLPDEAKVA